MVLQESPRDGACRRVVDIVSPVAQITVLNVDADVIGHLWPPIIVGYQLEGRKAACMSSNACIVVLFDDTTPKISVLGDIDLTVEHE
jgi:hypothetical protein